MIKFLQQHLIKPQNTIEADYFSHHYINWRAKRIAAILNRYGASFFFGKSLLEVGCAFGDIGCVFSKLGAKVTCSDARASYMDILKAKYPEIICKRADLEDDWQFDSFDVVLHMGVLYHLKDYIKPLTEACRNCKYLVLETEVADSDDPSFVIRTKEEGYDQAYNGFGVRPSAGAVEKVLSECNMNFERINDDRCNWDFHKYNWPVKNTNTWIHGQRRFWFGERK